MVNASHCLFNCLSSSRKAVNTNFIIVFGLTWPGIKPKCTTSVADAQSTQLLISNYRCWWKRVCDFWAHHQLPFFWWCSFAPTWISTIFLVLFLFFCFFRLLGLYTFKPLNALYPKLERLKKSGRFLVLQKLGVPGWGIPSIEFSKILKS